MIIFRRVTIWTESTAFSLGHSINLLGESYDQKILVLNTAKGGVASAWMLHEMTARGITPKGILFNEANTILVQGAALANMAMCDRFEDGDVTSLIKSGQIIEVDPAAGEVIILD